MLDRRQFLISSLAASLSYLATGCRQFSPPWESAAYRKKVRSQVAILGAKNYEIPLREIVLRGLKLFRINVQGKTVVLKPNLVEYDPAGVINTHPAVISAAIEAFRTLGARDVTVAEGPGHRRDIEYLLTASGLYSILKDHKALYVNLNEDDIRPLKLQSHFTNLKYLYFPETVLNADLLVSMPKLKTHHWAGVTLSLKNMFGVVPGSIYGWPKNTLHWAGIDESIADINSSLPIPRFAIVDGIVGMEGNGPIQGTAKHCGVMIFGEDHVAVDATAARLMKIEPMKIKYLEWAEQFLGNTAEEKIEQIGERLDSFRQDFHVIQSFQHLKILTGGA
jgi:uncharacterized protein (DUF362 family)